MPSGDVVGGDVVSGDVADAVDRSWVKPASGGRDGRAGLSQRSQRRQRGYSLVMLIMAISVLNIMLAAALPKWSEMIKRDKEEELISRGWQYAEAIRIFQRRFQRYPIKLEELIKVKPRCIRQLWKDPMTESGDWTLIFQGQGQAINVAGGRPGAQPPALFPGADPSRPSETAAIGPIVGVRSRSPQHSLLKFFGHERYDEWDFRADMLMQGLNQNFHGVGVKLPISELSLSTRWLGRPMPDFVPPGGMPPSNLGPGGPPGGPKPPGGAGGSFRPGRP
jgi:type II secretory pathway pseudopilin PulG